MYIGGTRTTFKEIFNNLMISFKIEKYQKAHYQNIYVVKKKIIYVLY